ncbi:SDR family NAD(P)-dependent oxidoreductase [Nocardia colli]|uniref:SDR family NAD(P)-dependent oxidoreductase n=1 Tax=Nocardia colli TaxID=2545717 RepID=A0A5N0ECF7_9NOCA|nr:SDR family NAD(P)-dependent oxidoreductase [Nocardia colli]
MPAGRAGIAPDRGHRGLSRPDRHQSLGHRAHVGRAGRAAVLDHAQDDAQRPSAAGHASGQGGPHHRAGHSPQCGGRAHSTRGPDLVPARALVPRPGARDDDRGGQARYPHRHRGIRIPRSRRSPRGSGAVPHRQGGRQPGQPRDPDRGGAVNLEPGVAVVTGAGSGIGRGTAKALAAQGATVIVADLDRAGADETVSIIESSGGKAVAYRLDVADTVALTAFAEQIRAEHGVPDVVVNNAGILVGGPFLDIPLDDLHRIIDINLMAMIHGCRIFGAQMVERGRGGHLVNIASMGAFAPYRLGTPYCVSKYAVKHFSDCLRAELAQHRIGVTAVCPGLIATHLADTASMATLTDGEADTTKEVVARAMALIAMDPDKAGRHIATAIRKNQAIKPIRLEAWLSYYLSRLSPTAHRAVMRVATGPELERVGRTLLASVPTQLRERQRP